MTKLFLLLMKEAKLKKRGKKMVQLQRGHVCYYTAAMTLPRVGLSKRTRAQTPAVLRNISIFLKLPRGSKAQK